MAKRRLEFDPLHHPPAKYARTKQAWFVRVGLLQGPEARTRYGGRESINMESFLPPNKRDLTAYSLIIPSFTQRFDIPSGEEKQRSRSWLWNVYQHPRYFGLLDLDMDLGRVQAGEEPLFTDSPVQVYTDKGQVKLAFARRLLDGSTFGQILQLCPPFALLHGAVKNLLASLQVPDVTYFSGGGGFRVLLDTKEAWRTVTWGTNYATVFHEQELPLLLAQVAPGLNPLDLATLLASTDKNIYDCDKGTKPDLLAHFDTKIFPHPLDENFESSRPSCTQASEDLLFDIRFFWAYVFRSIPTDPPTPIIAPVGKPPIYPNPLYEFPKSKISEATHFVSQLAMTSYRCVNDPEQLYPLLLSQRNKGLPLNWHEIRTPITRHTLDYDGGPALLEELQTQDGQMETPLHALQILHHETVLEPGQALPGLLLTCPPRAGTTGDRAHLIWPDWYVNMTDERAIVDRIQQGMTIRWPQVNWTKIIESPPKLRALFSDTVDKDTGLMANRSLVLNTVFDPEGQVMDIKETFPETTDLDLLRLCSLRVLDKDDSHLTPLQTFPVQARTAEHLTSTNLASLEETDRVAVLALMQAALDQVRVKHKKPKAKFYPGKNMRILTTGKYRHLEWSIVEHHQCAPSTTHHNNNVSLSLYIDRDQWTLRCFSKGCPQNSPVYHRDKGSAIYEWRQGWIDTSVLRSVWPLKPETVEVLPETGPVTFSVETPPPSPVQTESESEPVSITTLLVPDDRWDGKNVLIKESEVPAGDWTSIFLSQESDTTQTWSLTEIFWSDTRQVRRFRYSMIHPYPMRLVPCQGLQLR